MKLLQEFNQDNRLELITEAAGDKKHLYISGVFAEAELKNRNGRIYPSTVMKKAINEYCTEFVDKRRALGEISHPENRPQVKPELASHLITELHMDGNTVYGKAKVLDTPQGQVLRGLLEGGVQMGVSTRALGQVREQNGTTYVENDLKIFAVDTVTDPSQINAFVDAINESCDWLITDDGKIVEQMRHQIKTKKLTEEHKLQLMADFFKAIRG